ncbi:MAG: hypothetical protein ACWA5P_01460 [bacterium]
MKRCVMIMLCLSVFWGCSESSTDQDNFSFEILPIATVDIPETLINNDVNRITFSYNVPSSCHTFSDLYYIENGNQRTIAVVNLVTESFGSNQQCESYTDIIDERGFDFYAPPGFDSIIFNFWQGEDEAGDDIYYTVEVPVE